MPEVNKWAKFMSYWHIKKPLSKCLVNSFIGIHYSATSSWSAFIAFVFYICGLLIINNSMDNSANCATQWKSLSSVLDWHLIRFTSIKFSWMHLSKLAFPHPDTHGVFFLCLLLLISFPSSNLLLIGIFVCTYIPLFRSWNANTTKIVNKE